MSDELAQGGNGGPEIIFLPKGAQVYPQKQDQPGQQFNIMIMPFKDTQELREFVQAIVRETLEEDARAIRERKEFQPVKQAGTCCACLMAGEDMEWVGNRLAHKTEECRRIAAEMPAVREHRG